ncbi:MAG: hypothetical protein ACK5JD_06190 [Mangrovibacterium sp.]
MSSTLVKNNIEALITCKALGLFLFNFRMPEIKELCEKSREFDHVWSGLLKSAKQRQKKKGGMLIINHTDFYDAFYSKMSYETQALIIEKARETHEEDARESIEFSISISKQMEDAQF